MSSRVDRLVRSWVPSTAVLSRTAVFRLVSSICDAPMRLGWRPHTRRPIPPLRYIVRTGVGNRILLPHFQYLTLGANQWLCFLARGWARLDSTIVDLGCGVGKSAVTLRDYGYSGERFTGRYIGYDADPEMIAWCTAHFPQDRFRFVHVDMKSGLYNPAGGAHLPRLDCPDRSVDLVFSQSLLSHLLEDDVMHYLRESYRILKPSGNMAMTFFCIEDLRAQSWLGGRWRFEHRRGRALIENPRYPEAAVAYRRSDMIARCREVGFRAAEVVLPHYQSTLWARP